PGSAAFQVEEASLRVRAAQAPHRSPGRWAVDAARDRARRPARAPRGLVAPRPLPLRACATAVPPLQMTPLLLLFTLAFVVTVDVRILAPVLPSIAASLGATAGAGGLVTLSYSLVYGTGQLVYVPLLQLFGRSAVVIFLLLRFMACMLVGAL